MSDSPIAKPNDAHGLVTEAWAQGFMVGALIVMACVAAANMRRNVMLHKLIILELMLGTFHGTFIFTDPPVYHWYLSATAILLNVSWSLHNVIAWMKNKPFFEVWQSRAYIWTVALAQIYWVIEVIANFLYYSGINSALFSKTRVLEALFRDPWWVLTTISLLWNIIYRYEFGLVELVRISPRFGILIGAMLVSIVFMMLDLLAVGHVIEIANLPDGLNPFWKLSYVFKCLTDTIVLDDFKTALDRLSEYKRRGITGSHGNDAHAFNDFKSPSLLHNTRNQASLSPQNAQRDCIEWHESTNDVLADLESRVRSDSTWMSPSLDRELQSSKEPANIG